MSKTKKMNNKIEVSYCSVEVSKLLKEKGADLSSEKNTWILAKDKDKGEEAHFTTSSHYELENITEIDDETFHNVYHVLSFPSHDIAIKWILANFGLWLYVEPDCYGEEWYPKVKISSEKTWKNKEMRSMSVQINNKLRITKIHKTPEDAIDDGLLHILKELN